MEERPLTRGEEIANSITHGLALIASMVGLPALVVVAVSRGDPWQIVGGAVFGSTLLLLFAVSTLYHALPDSRLKRIFRVLDHSAIYLLIAGTYTPFTLGALRGPWGWTLFGTVWGLALAGILFKTTVGFRFPHLSTAVYIVLGWLVVIAIRPLVTQVSPAGVAWLVGGGLFYTGGVVFYVWERLRYGHAVWHVFVAAGSTCHFLAVLWHASPAVA
jgi:hemolysin III